MAIGVGAGLVAGGLLGGIGDAISAAGQEPPPERTLDLNLQSDPLNVQIALDAMLQLGDTTGLEVMLQQASPLQQQIDRINRSPYMTNRDKQAAIGFMKAKWQGTTLHNTAEFPDAIEQSAKAYAQAVGFVGLPRQPLTTQDRLQWEQQSQAIAERIVAGGAGPARLQAVQDLGRIANQIGGLEEGRGSLTQDFFARQIDRTTEDSIEQLLTSANLGGFNPGRGLGEILKTRNEEHQDTPFKALELDLARLKGLEEFIQQGTSNAQSATGIRNAGALSGAQIAANQMSAADSARTGAAANRQSPAGSLVGALGDTIQLGALFSQPRPGANPSSSLSPQQLADAAGLGAGLTF